jgi:hypothetical protein
MVKVFAFAFLAGISSIASAQSPADLEKNQTRIFDAEPEVVIAAIQSFHRDRGLRCDANPVFVSCTGKNDSYTYHLEQKEEKTKVRLVVGGAMNLSMFGLREKITQTTFNQIEKQLLKDFAPNTPRSAEDASNSNSILPALSREGVADRESRRFDHPVKSVKAGIAAYFVNAKGCTQYVENFRCTRMFLGMPDRRSPPIDYVIEYKEVDEKTTDVRVRVSGTVFENYDELFKAVIEHIKHQAKN